MTMWCAYTASGSGTRNTDPGVVHGTRDGERTLCGAAVCGEMREIEFTPDEAFACRRCARSVQNEQHPEVGKLRARLDAQTRHSIALQRLIEWLCRGELAAIDSADAPHHYEMVRNHLGVEPKQ